MLPADFQPLSTPFQMNNLNLFQLGEVFRKQRLELNFTVEDVAAIAGISTRTYIKTENEGIGIKTSTLKKIADALNLVLIETAYFNLLPKNS